MKLIKLFIILACVVVWLLIAAAVARADCVTVKDWQSCDNPEPTPTPIGWTCTKHDYGWLCLRDTPSPAETPIPETYPGVVTYPMPQADADIFAGYEAAPIEEPTPTPYIIIITRGNKK